MSMTPAEILMHTTVRLECLMEGNYTLTRTGFFFSFKGDDKTHVPVIVTCKHLIDRSKIGTFVLTKMNDQGEPIIGATEQIVLENFESFWIRHPEESIDLAVFPVAPLYRQAEAKGIKLFAPPISEDLLGTPEKLADLSGLENIIMIGYPNGIWDEKNNMPIVRSGITATNPKYDYNGLPIFLIDCACFPGSSGSPVLIFDQGGYQDAKGILHLGGNRVILLGVLFAGPQHVAEGEIQTVEVPLAQVPIILSKIPNNLGFVVKAQKIADFREMLILENGSVHSASSRPW